jgi:hypothetical protein
MTSQPVPAARYAGARAPDDLHESSITRVLPPVVVVKPQRGRAAQVR